MTKSPSSRSLWVARLLWSRFIWRHWRREPKLTLVLLAILALGVAVFLSIRLANKAAVSGFTLFTESISGESDLLVRPLSGSLGDGTLVEIRELLGPRPVGIFPVLEVTAADRDDPEGPLYQLLGTDLVALRNAVNYTEAGTVAPPSEGGATSPDRDEEGRSALGRSDRGYISETLAAAKGLAPGDTLSLVVNGAVAELEIAGVLPDTPLGQPVPERLVLLDLPGLQTLAGREGWLSRVELRVAPGSRYASFLEETETLLREEADDRWTVETPQTRRDTVTTMSAAFRLNLAILSSLALLVGTYLILQAMEASVVKRRSEIAILRSLGVTPREIRLAWMTESLVLGVVGSALGILLGRLLAEGLVGAIARTVNTLYYQTTTSAISLGMGEALFSFAFGVVACVIAALIPAREASRTPPALTMRSGTQGGGLALLRNIPLGAGLVVVALACSQVPPVRTGAGVTIPLGGYAAALFFVLGASILLGLLFRPLALCLRGRGGDPLRSYAASQFRRPEGRHRLTAAGLAVAIGMSAAMGILVSSFESTLTGWIRQMLKADLYVSGVGTSSIANVSILPEETWRAVAGREGVAGVDVLRRYDIVLDGRDTFLAGVAYQDDPERYLRLMWLDPPADDGPRALLPTDDSPVPTWVNESFTRHSGQRKGDVIELPTPEGPKRAIIAGVYADYATETGAVLVARELTSEWFGDDDVSQMSVYVEDGVDVERIRDEMRADFPALSVRTNERLREESLRIFHQTFSVTYALEAIAVIIAVTGLGLALAGLLLERVHELTTLKSLGATRKGIAAATAWEGFGLALTGLVSGFLLSLALGWVLIDVINPQCFGWTLDYAIPWWSLAALAVLTATVAAAVAWVVGFRNANLRSDLSE